MRASEGCCQHGPCSSVMFRSLQVKQLVGILRHNSAGLSTSRTVDG